VSGYIGTHAQTVFQRVGRPWALVSAQMIAYHERFPPGARMLRLMHDAVTVGTE